MAYSISANSSTNDIELLSLKSDRSLSLQGTNEGNSSKKKQERTVNFSSDIDINGNKTPKKNVQFSSQVPDSPDFEAKPNLIPNRKREEEIVMENLRRRVGDNQLDKNFRRQEVEEKPNEDASAVPLLSKIAAEEKPYKPPKQTTDQDFILDCLCWHNEYRARHGASAMSVSSKLCERAQLWANHLANLNELYYCSRTCNFGQNIFCCPETSLLIDLTGQEVATYWYSSLKRYNFYKDPELLHTNVNAGHFTQIVWKNSKFMGVGKASSSTGKVFVVALYFPPGNIVGEFYQNVQPPIVESEEFRSNSENSNK